MLLKLLANLFPRRPSPAPVDQPADAVHAEQRRAHQRMARLELPGPDYLQSLAAIHALVKPRTYLEIGVAKGHTLALAGPLTRAIGVDPEPVLAQPPAANARVYALTSDEFFAHTDVTREFGGLPVDLAFIDGMHLFDFALRDFIAVERLCARESAVLVHDTYPLDSITAGRERTTHFWSGDIWRLVLALKKYRPDLSIQTIAAAPTGLTLIRGLDPASNVLSAQRDAIIEEFRALEFDAIENDKPAVLNVVANDPANISRLFGPL
jgi:predicted O-methyltransferase YrrM